MFVKYNNVKICRKRKASTDLVDNFFKKFKEMSSDIEWYRS